MIEVLEVRKGCDLIVGNVKNAEIGIILEARDLGEDVVRYVELFELGEIGQAGYCWKSIGLYR